MSPIDPLPQAAPHFPSAPPLLYSALIKAGSCYDKDAPSKEGGGCLAGCLKSPALTVRRLRQPTHRLRPSNAPAEAS